LSDGNAISIFRGTPTVKANTISNYSFPGVASNDFFDAAYAMLLECMQGGTVANNTITNSQGGIVAAFPNCPTSGVYITGNTISESTFIAIDMGQTNASVSGNDIRNSRTVIRMPNASNGNTIFSNRINDVCAAFASTPRRAKQQHRQEHHLQCVECGTRQQQWFVSVEAMQFRARKQGLPGLSPGFIPRV
jgi:Right handed beta helix region